MFETSVVRANAAVRPRSRFSLLTVSLLAHSAVVAGVIAVSIANVDFPVAAPDEILPLYTYTASPPPPLGTPDGGKKAAATPPEQKKPATPPPVNQVTAPSTVPENITPADTPSTGTSDVTGPSTGGTTEGPIGVPWGDDKGLGDPNAPPSVNPGPPPAEKIYEVGEVTAPRIIQRVEPVYPALWLKVKKSGNVAVRCVIDKNGRIRNPQVIVATNDAFAESVLQALQKWRYTPASLNGEAVECYLDLNVSFGVK